GICQPPIIHFCENSFGIVHHFGATEARDALKELFLFVIFVQSVECPSQHTTVNFRRRCRSSFLRCLHYTPPEPFATSVHQIIKALPGCLAKVAKECDEAENTEHSDQGRRRKRSIVGTVGTKDWHQRDTSIHPYRKSDPPNHDTEDGVVNVEQEYDETRKEEEKGKVQQGG
ncbi:hypothetical protein BJV78DRAFT_1260648, partial [Lactifluus subvellereus]